MRRNLKSEAERFADKPASQEESGWAEQFVGKNRTYTGRNEGDWATSPERCCLPAKWMFFRSRPIRCKCGRQDVLQRRPSPESTSHVHALLHESKAASAQSAPATQELPFFYSCQNSRSNSKRRRPLLTRQAITRFVVNQSLRKIFFQLCNALHNPFTDQRIDPATSHSHFIDFMLFRPSSHPVCFSPPFLSPNLSKIKEIASTYPALKPGFPYGF